MQQEASRAEVPLDPRPPEDDDSQPFPGRTHSLLRDILGQRTRLGWRQSLRNEREEEILINRKKSSKDPLFKSQMFIYCKQLLGIVKSNRVKVLFIPSFLKLSWLFTKS